MSQAQKASSKGKQVAAQREARVITKEKHVPAKVQVGTPPTIDFRRPDKLLKDAVTVIVSDGVNTRSWTIHHPVGRTNLGDNDWVLSPAERVPDLLARRTDDDAPRLAQLRALERYKLAMAANLLKKDADGIICYPDGTSRDATIAHARERAKRKNAEALANWQKTKPRDGDVGPVSMTYVEAIPKVAWRNYERNYIDYVNDESVQEKVEAKYPDTFQTRGGPNKDIDQVSACPKGRPPPGPGPMFDGLVYQLSNLTIMSFVDAKEMMEKGQMAETPAVIPKGEQNSDEENDSSDYEPSDEESDVETSAAVVVTTVEVTSTGSA